MLEDLDLSDLPPKPAAAPDAPASPPQGAPVFVVQLRSGGPRMTVGGTTKEGGVVCAWFAGDDLRTQVFAPSMLVPVPETSS